MLKKIFLGKFPGILCDLESLQSHLQLIITLALNLFLTFPDLDNVSRPSAKNDIGLR